MAIVSPEMTARDIRGDPNNPVAARGGKILAGLCCFYPLFPTLPSIIL
ncbi:MAG: hypothetical protein V4671_16400 [Armatimonadota bacterium]